MNFPVELDEWIENPKAHEDGNVDRDMYGLQPFHPLPPVGMKAMPESRSEHSRGRLETLDALLSRYRRVLSLIACRVLGNHEEAERAVRNCIRVASDSAPRFDHEGAFRSWLARILIDEAVTILYKQGHPQQADLAILIARAYGTCESATPPPCTGNVKADLPPPMLRISIRTNDELSRNINSLSPT